MVEIKTNKLNLICFSDKIEFKNGFKKIAYKQSSVSTSKLLFKKTIFYTLHNNLEIEEDLLLQFNKNTVYEIKRALKDNVKFSILNDATNFVEQYNLMAKKQNLIPITLKNISAQLDSQKLLLTCASNHESELVYHTYIIDKLSGRVRLQNSVTNSGRMTDTAKRAEIGRANRLLHYQDMLHFKQLGFKLYDFGGYAYETNSSKLESINKFKEGFGGILVKEFDFIPYWILLMVALKNALRKTLKK